VEKYTEINLTGFGSEKFEDFQKRHNLKIGHEEGIAVVDTVGSTDGDALGLSLGDDDGLFLMIIVKKRKLFL
jgi:hypothetical protein